MGNKLIYRGFELGILYRMRVGYIVKNLNSYNKNKIHGTENPLFEAWRSKKENGIIAKLESGLNPLQLHPIDLVIDCNKNKFHVDDGISRLRVFRKKGIKTINAILRYA